MVSETPNALAVVGNPGAGKSTLLNGLVGSVVFESGISVGPGLTYQLDSYEANGFTLYDTPGLSDISRAKEAGKQLDKLMSKNKNIKLCFVVVLEGGRASQEDAATIDAVLSSIKSVPNVNDTFGVIINKVSPRVMGKLSSNEGDAAVLVRNGLTGKFETSHWLYLPYEEGLYDEDNKMLTSPEITAFIAGLPTTKPRNATVTKIDTDTLEERKEEHRKRIEEIKDLHRAEMDELRNKFESELHRQSEVLQRVQKQADERGNQLDDAHEQIENLTERFENMGSESSSVRSDLERYKHKTKKRVVTTGVLGGAGLAVTGLATLNPIAFLGGVSAMSAGIGAWLAD